MKIIVINLDAETKRLEFQQQQMAYLGLKFERLRATEVKDLTTQELNNQKDQWERPMRPGEVACLASHRNAWKISVAENNPVLVLEDDAFLAANTPEILTELEKKNGLDHVTLELRGRKKILGKEPLPLTSTTKLTRLYQDRTGAATYVVWPEGARKLLARSARAAGLADAIIAAAYELSSWQIEPAPAMQLDQCKAYGFTPPLATTTTIGTSSHHKPKAENLLQNVIFKYRRIKSQLRMGMRQLSTITIARRRFVAVEISDFPTHILTNK